MTVTEEIKQRLDIVELIGSHGVQLRKAGRNFTGFCPFHPNARTPAFYVFPDTQSYYCFSCHKSGDAFAFVMEKEGLPFGEALEQLAGRAGVRLPERTGAAREAQEQENALQARLRQINEDTAIYWNHLLRNAAKGEPGRVYAANRVLDTASIETWQIGYAPEDWSDLLRYLTDRKGYTPEEVEQAGLAIKRERGGYYDRFRNRLMFPIRDLRGAVVGFGGRALGDDHAKYMNTPETPIFHKSSLLFGLHQAREGIRGAGGVVIVEGYLDVITAHQAGFANVVAPMGTALTADQVQLLRKLTSTIYLALDADAAGVRAAEKGLDSILETGEQQLVIRGHSLDWTADLDLSVKIIQLPAGSDPDDIIKADPQHWRALVAGALPVMEFFFALHTRGLDLREAEDQHRALSKLAPIVASIQDFSKRAVYENRLANLLQMKFEFVRATVIEATKQGQRRQRSSERSRAPAAPVSVFRADPYASEDRLLSFLLRFPQVRDKVEATLASDLEAFPELRDEIPVELHDVFRRTENRLIWAAWSEHGVNGPADVAGWLLSLDPELRSYAEGLLNHPDQPPLSKAAPLHDARNQAVGIAKNLRRFTAERRRAEMSEMTHSVEDQQDHARLEHKLKLVLEYCKVVTMPPRSTVFDDLGSRKEKLA